MTTTALLTHEPEHLCHHVRAVRDSAGKLVAVAMLSAYSAERSQRTEQLDTLGITIGPWTRLGRVSARQVFPASWSNTGNLVAFVTEDNSEEFRDPTSRCLRCSRPSSFCTCGEGSR